ncbi:MAG TPA: DUF4846 domain-containing protein [Candidatus Butyricimonas faecavium]|nr:DUF4846 domain-containing protein [Candidatus Butyricimonas faecavium]
MGLKCIILDSMQIDDVLVQRGSPGHAVIVVSMAENLSTGEKLYLLAQSHMSVQGIQVLENPKERDKSPWYSPKERGIFCSRGGFAVTNLKRFKD